jgi:hypothetical protein
MGSPVASVAALLVGQGRPIGGACGERVRGQRGMLENEAVCSRRMTRWGWPGAARARRAVEIISLAGEKNVPCAQARRSIFSPSPDARVLALKKSEAKQSPDPTA